jgi:hypothetical protein
MEKLEGVDEVLTRVELLEVGHAVLLMGGGKEIIPDWVKLVVGGYMGLLVGAL